MKVAKTYILEESYPGSPKIGDKVVETFTTGGICDGYILMSSISSPSLIKFKKEDIENFPNHWKPHN